VINTHGTLHGTASTGSASVKEIEHFIYDVISQLKATHEFGFEPSPDGEVSFVNIQEQICTIAWNVFGITGRQKDRAGYRTSVAFGV
jgi:membrane protease subunit (stomatin/prohibitin family)